MFSLMYDEARAKEVAWEEGREDGLEEGIEKGIEKGMEKGSELKEAQLVERMILKGWLAEDIAEATDISLEKVNYIRNRLTKADMPA
jgi:flagellar biosynthesis/type III secretory pathway protein FliH